MQKMPTLFLKDPLNNFKVINQVDPDCKWVSTEGIPTRKFDGSACAIFDGVLYKRYDVKKNKKTGEYKVVPPHAIPCQEPDEITGHWPHWVLCDKDKPEDKYFWEALERTPNFPDGTYELIGEKVQGNPEDIEGHLLIPHGIEEVDIRDYSFETIKEFLSKEENNIEGIVFHNINNPDIMCKIRKKDFGFKRT